MSFSLQPICHLFSVYIEALEPSLIDRVLIPSCPFNSYKPGLSITLSLIPKPLFQLIIILIILIIDNHNNKFLIRNQTRYYIIRYPCKPKQLGQMD